MVSLETAPDVPQKKLGEEDLMSLVDKNFPDVPEDISYDVEERSFKRKSAENKDSSEGNIDSLWEDNERDEDGFRGLYMRSSEIAFKKLKREGVYTDDILLKIKRILRNDKYKDIKTKEFKQLGEKRALILEKSEKDSPSYIAAERYDDMDYTEEQCAASIVADVKKGVKENLFH